jgi:hypothetical protein
MSFPKGSASSPTNAAEFYSTTRELLIDARRNRDEALLRRGADRVNGERFNALSDDRQEDLLQLYGAAMVACGAFSP